MKIKKFKNFVEPVNEEILTGALVIGGFIAAMGAGAVIDYASSAWTKWMMERKYKPTGKEEMVQLNQNGEVSEHKFIEVKDKDTGETFMGVTVVDSTTADPGYEKEQFFIFDKKGFEELKKKWSEGNSGDLSGHHKKWNLRPGN